MDRFGNTRIVFLSHKNNGQYALEIGPGAGGRAQTVTVTAGTSYVLSGLGRITHPNDLGWIGVHYLDALGNQVAQQSYISFESIENDLKSILIQTPANTAQIRI